MTAPRTGAARTALRLVLLASVTAGLPACNAVSRISEIGQPPALTQIKDPQAQPGYTPVSLPMPAALPAERNPNSLWRTGAKAFFKDQRAARVGDLLTVLVEIDDEAQIANQTTRSRSNAENAGLTNFLGLESRLKAILPDAVDPTSLVDASSTGSSQGKGQINRSEKIELKLAVLVTQTLPNGNLVVQGRQEVRVNYEARDLIITGVIRPEDITATNTIRYDQIAEARIAYGGRGQLTDVQQPRYGQQLFDIIMPF